YWTALVPSTSATLLAGTLAILLLRRRPLAARPSALIAAWAITLAAAGATAGRAGLGALLTAAFLLQVTPSLWTAYRTPRPTGVSPSAAPADPLRGGNLPSADGVCRACARLSELSEESHRRRGGGSPGLRRRPRRLRRAGRPVHAARAPGRLPARCGGGGRR